MSIVAPVDAPEVTVREVTHKSIMITWTEVSSNGTGNITGYSATASLKDGSESITVNTSVSVCSKLDNNIMIVCCTDIIIGLL